MNGVELYGLNGVLSWFQEHTMGNQSIGDVADAITCRLESGKGNAPAGCLALAPLSCAGETINANKTKDRIGSFWKNDFEL